MTVKNIYQLILEPWNTLKYDSCCDGGYYSNSTHDPILEAVSLSRFLHPSCPILSNLYNMVNRVAANIVCMSDLTTTFAKLRYEDEKYGILVSLGPKFGWLLGQCHFLALPMFTKSVYVNCYSWFLLASFVVRSHLFGASFQSHPINHVDKLPIKCCWIQHINPPNCPFQLLIAQEYHNLRCIKA